MLRLTGVVLLTSMALLGAEATLAPDMEMRPTPYIAAGEGGRVYFRMLPDRDDPGNRDKGSGFAYRVGADKDELMWQVAGWYSYRVFLSDRGRYLVRLGNWPRGHQPSESDLAVAFYDEGVLLKQYSTRELIKDDSKVRPSSSHYEYLELVAEIGFTRTPTTGVWPLHWFKLTTVDGIEYTFDRRTGNIVQTENAKRDR